MSTRFDPDALESKVRGAARDFRYDSKIILRFDKLSPSSQGLYAWVEMRVGSMAANPFHFGRYDLMGPRTAPALAKAGRDQIENYDWDSIITTCTYQIIQSFLEGPEPVDLADVDPDTSPKWLIRPNLTASGATSIVAAGGSGKSLYALALALTVATGSSRFLGTKPHLSGPVLYLDWEADAPTHNERMLALCHDGDLPERNQLIYSEQRQPLSRISDSIAKYADSYGVVLIIVDSVMLARGGEANYSDPTIDFYAALREIGRPSALIDHKSKTAIRKGQAGSYGSIVNENSTRLMWDIGGAHDLPVDDPRTSRRVIKLRPGKRNNFGELPDLAYQITIVNDDQDRMKTVDFTPTNPTKVVMTAGRYADPNTEWTDNILGFLKANPDKAHTVAEISDAISADHGTVRTYLNRNNLFAKKGRDGRSTLWQVEGWTHQDSLPDPL